MLISLVEYTLIPSTTYNTLSLPLNLIVEFPKVELELPTICTPETLPANAFDKSVSFACVNAGPETVC